MSMAALDMVDSFLLLYRTQTPSTPLSDFVLVAENPHARKVQLAFRAK
jgi:hypothetical protein